MATYISSFIQHFAQQTVLLSGTSFKLKQLIRIIRTTCILLECKWFNYLATNSSCWLLQAEGLMQYNKGYQVVERQYNKGYQVVGSTTRDTRL